MKFPYFKNIDRAEDFILDNINLEPKEVRKLIRYILEDTIKFRYYKHLKKKITTVEGKVYDPITEKSGSTLGLMIDKLEVSSVSFNSGTPDSVISEPRRLNDYSKGDNHGTLGTFESEVMESDTEVKSFLKSTIDLIDNKL